MVPIKILHITNGLSIGGTEATLYKLVASLDRTDFYNQVISLTDRGPIGKKICDLGINVHQLKMSRRLPNPLAAFKLAKIIKAEKPDVVHAWMYHADIIGGLVSKLVGNIPVIWEVRHANLDPRRNKRRTLLTVRVCSLFSGLIPTNIVFNSWASYRVHRDYGYKVDRALVISNGFDTDKFQPNNEAKVRIRKRHGIPLDSIIIGHVGRYHPQKDHLNFIKAAAKVKSSYKKIYFILCGDGVDHDNIELVNYIKSYGIRDKCLLLGRRLDMPRLISAFDVSVSSSAGESFSNSIGEAMSCGVPCVVTNVGDSAKVVGDTGVVVPPGTEDALADAIAGLIQMGADKRRMMGVMARNRILKYYLLKNITKKYEMLYRDLASENIVFMHNKNYIDREL